MNPIRARVAFAGASLFSLCTHHSSPYAPARRASDTRLATLSNPTPGDQRAYCAAVGAVGNVGVVGAFFDDAGAGLGIIASSVSGAHCAMAKGEE